jgi:hypothetical protein
MASASRRCSGVARRLLARSGDLGLLLVGRPRLLRCTRTFQVGLEDWTRYALHASASETRACCSRGRGPRARRLPRERATSFDSRGSIDERQGGRVCARLR